MAMSVIKLLNGASTFMVYDFKLSATVVEGQPVIASTTGADGGSVEDATTTSLLDAVGIVQGAGDRGINPGVAGTLTYSVTVGDTEGLVRVIVNSDQIVRARMSGDGTTGTSLQTVTNTTADTNRVTVTATDTPENSMDDGLAWGLSGANIGQSRKVTTYTANTSFVLTVPLPRDIGVNDTFAVGPFLPLTTVAITLTSDLLEVDGSVAPATGGNARVLAVDLNGITDSFVHFIFRDHFANELS